MPSAKAVKQVPVLRPLIDAAHSSVRYTVKWRVLVNGKATKEYPEGSFYEACVQVFYAKRPNGAMHPLQRREAGVAVLRELLEKHFMSLDAWEKGYIQLPVKVDVEMYSSEKKWRDIAASSIRLLNFSAKIFSLEKVPHHRNKPADFHLVLEE